jgi:hypothetical protein
MVGLVVGVVVGVVVVGVVVVGVVVGVGVRAQAPAAIGVGAGIELWREEILVRMQKGNLAGGFKEDWRDSWRGGEVDHRV